MSSAREAAESVGRRLARGLLISRYDERDQKAIAVAGKLIDQAIAAAILAEREACAKMADADAKKSSEALERAVKRYKNRELLAAVGHQGDPDAECIAMEASRDIATGIAAAIRARQP
jgi:hypothetical protein